MKHFLTSVLACVLFSFATASVSLAAIPIKGINGVEISFAGVFDAKPEGLLAVVQPEGSAIIVPWDRIDLDDLQVRQPDIHGAYLRAVESGKMQPLGLGIAERMLSLELVESAIKYSLTQTRRWPYTEYAFRKTVSVNNKLTKILTYDDNLSDSIVTRGITNSLYKLFIEIRDVNEDRRKDNLHQNLKQNKSNIDDLLRKLDRITNDIPDPKTLPRTDAQSRMIAATRQFCVSLRRASLEDKFSPDFQSSIKYYFNVIGL